MEKINKYKGVVKSVADKLAETKLNNFTKLLAVSKRRSIEDMLSIYNEGQRDFGENYVPEIVEKSAKLPEDINWHLIGHLQGNKCRKILQIKNLKMIESVDSVKLADELEKECKKLGRTIEILIQVNISQEETKSGVMPENLIQLFKDIYTKCEKVKPVGIMSLGKLGDIEQFRKMYNFKLEICEELSIEKEKFVLSLGTSDDFESAILEGSNEVRVGGLIFA